jgi:hypothetical protein
VPPVPVITRVTLTCYNIGRLGDPSTETFEIDQSSQPWSTLRMSPKTSDAITDDPDGSHIRSGTAIVTPVENSIFVRIGQAFGGTQYQFDGGALTGLTVSFGKLGQIICRLPQSPTT